MGKVLGIVYRTIATHLIHKACHTHATAKTGAVTPIQCFGGSVNLNIHFHMLFLDGAYVDGPHGLRFRWVNASTSAELTHLAQTIAHRTARFLERQALLERDAEQAYLTADSGDDEAMDSLLQPAITYRIAVGPHQGRKVMTFQTLPPDDPFEPGAGQVAGFSLHAGVAARAHEREKLERLCRYVSRPPVAERRLSIAAQGNIRYRLKTPYRDGTTHVIFEPLEFMGYVHVPHPCGAACGCANRLSCRLVIAKLAALAPAKPDWRFASLPSKKPCRLADQRVPRPRINLTRYHGLFAPNCRIRAQITPVRRQSTPAPNPEDSPTPPRAGMSWAQRLKRVFNIDIETCLHCGGTLKVIACIEDPDIIHKILTHLEHKADAASPAIRPPQRAPPQVDWIA